MAMVGSAANLVHAHPPSLHGVHGVHGLHGAWPPLPLPLASQGLGPLSPLPAGGLAHGLAHGLYGRYGLYSLYGLSDGLSDGLPAASDDGPVGLGVPVGGGVGSAGTPSGLAALGFGLGPSTPHYATSATPSSTLSTTSATAHLVAAHKVPGETLFSSAFSFGSPLGSPLASPGSPPVACGALGLGQGSLVYQQQAGPFIDNSGASAASAGPVAVGAAPSRWDADALRHRPAALPALPSPLAVNVKLDSGGKAASSPATARGTPLQSPQPSGLLSPGCERASVAVPDGAAHGATHGAARPADDRDRACQVAEVTTSGEHRDVATVSTSTGSCQPGLEADNNSYSMLRGPSTASQFVLLATAPGINMDAVPRCGPVGPMLWPTGFAAEGFAAHHASPSPLLLPAHMLLDGGGVPAMPTMMAAVSSSGTASVMTISRTVTAHREHHSVNSVSAHCVSNAVALPAVPALPPVPMAVVPPPPPTLLAMASLSHVAVSTPWTAAPQQAHHQVPRCISDGEAAVITQVADPSKQCSAAVQTQIDDVGASVPCGSPAASDDETSLAVDAARGTGDAPDGPPPGSVGASEDLSGDVAAEFDGGGGGEEASGAADVRRERSLLMTPLLAEADSNGEPERLMSPEPQISSSNNEETNVPDKPNDLDVSGLELLYKSIEHLESMEIKKLERRTDVTAEPQLRQAPELTGLGLLCALAEQRIQEEIQSESEAFKVKDSRCLMEKTIKPSSDVNRNYRTPQSELEVRRFLAARTESSNTSALQTASFKLTLHNEDEKEVKMRNRIAELQRMYKETQKELSRLTPRKNSSEGDSSSGSHTCSPHSKRTSTKNTVTRKRKSVIKKQTPHKTETLSDLPPPVLERVTDVTEVALPKIKWSRLDAPPTLIPHKPPNDLLPSNATSFKLNLVKLPASKDHKRRWSVDSSSARISTETQAADDEDSDGLWSSFILKTSEPSNINRKHKSPGDSASSSKRRKVGKPRRHFNKAGNGHHSTETIVAKQPRNKASLVNYLIASNSTGASGKLPNADSRFKESPKTETASSDSPEHRPKIRPMLKAEVKVKETWEDEDLLDWSAPRSQLPSDPLRQLDFDCVEEMTLNGHGKNLGVKRSNDDDDDVDWLPSAKKLKAPPTPSKSMSIPSFVQHNSKNSERGLPVTKSKKLSNVAKERRQSTDKHLKKPVCSSVEESKISSDPESCMLTADILDTADLPVRTLTAQGGLFYSGLLNAVDPPDLYKIALHGERASRPNIYSREEILQDTILEVRPPNVETLPIGTRLCAYWSQQKKCLYPGVVVPPSTPDPTLDGEFVTVEFDDGDSGQIRIQDIRLLPPDYPVVEFDPNPLQSLVKKRRRNSEKSVDSKDRRVSADSAISSNASISENTKEDVMKEFSMSEATGPSDAKETSMPASASVFQTLPSDSLLCSEVYENERKRLKKERRDKLKRLLTVDASAAADARKRKRKHKEKRRQRHSHSSSSSSFDVSRSDVESLPLDVLKKPVDSTKTLESSPLIKEEVLKIEEDVKCEEDFKKREQVENLMVKEEVKEEYEKEIFSDENSTVLQLPDPVTKSDESNLLEDDHPRGKKPKKKEERQNSPETSKMAAFLPLRKLWSWSGKGYKRQGGKGRKKEFYKCIQRDKEQINVGDCAVFLSTNSPDRPYIGRIESLWETYNGMMVVRVKWFYHPEETEGCPSLKYAGGLFQSDHADDNDVQTISHRCEVLPLSDYEKKVHKQSGGAAHPHDVYYLAGFYDPKNIQIKLEKGVAG